MALLLLTGLFLQTAAGRRGLAGLASRLLTGATGRPARVEAISGSLPFDFTVGRFALADADGVWLAVKDLRLAWSPWALLRGRLEVRAVTADIVRLRRLPASQPSPEAPMPLSWPPRFPRLPPILVDHLAVGRLILDPPVAGQAAVLSLTGRLAESGRGAVGAHLAVERLDGPSLRLSVAGSVNYAQWRLSVLANLDEAAGGLLSTALDGPGAGPLAVALQGDGPLTDWKARLTARLARQPVVTADLGLSVPLAPEAMAAWSLDATATPPTGGLPGWGARLAELTGQRLSLAAAGRYGLMSGAFFLDRSRIEAAVGSVEATAGLDPAADTLTGAVRVDVPEAGRLAPDLAGALSARLAVSGPLARPDLTATLSGQNLRAGPASLESARIEAKAGLAGPLAETFPGADVTVAGRLTGLAGPKGATLLGRDLELAVAARLADNGGLAVSRCDLTGPGGRLEATGDLAADGRLSGKVTATVGDLAGLASLAGLDLAGQATATAALARPSAGQGRAEVSARLDRLTSREATGAAPALAALLGPSPSLGASLTLSPSGLAHLDRLQLDGRAVRATGSGEVDPASGRIDTRLSAQLPDLSGLGPLVGAPAAGAASLTARLAGSPGALDLTASATVRGLRLDTLRLDGGEIEATARKIADNPAGHLRLSARRDKETANCDADFALTGPNLALTGLRLGAPGTSLEGQVSLDTAKGLVSGQLAGAATDLSGLGRFTGLALAGSLKLRLTAGSGRAGQSATVDLTAANLQVPGLAAKEARLSAALDDLSGLPKGKAKLTAKGVVSGGLGLSTLALTATGDGRALDATLASQGSLPGGKAVSLDATARLTRSAQGSQITVRNLSGSLDKRPLSLRAPASLTLAGATASLDNLDLSLAGARLTASGSLAPGKLAAQANLERLPLPLLALAGITGIDGAVSAGLSLAGSPAAPRLEATLRADPVTMGSATGRGLPPMALTATAALAGGKLVITASLAGAGKKPPVVTAQANLPVRFSLAPTVWELSPQGALSGAVKADGDLADVSGLLAQANLRLLGRLTADLTVSGSPAAPKLDGTVALAASRLESAATGLVLREVDLRLEAADGRLNLTRGTASDLAGGRLVLSGSIGPLAGDDAPIALEAKLSRLKVAGLDLVAATADGTARLTGSLASPKLGGALTIGPAEVNLPTSLPPSVVVIPVTLVNDPNAAAVPAGPAGPGFAGRLALDLALTLGQAVYVRGMGLESRWAGSVAVSGTAGAPLAKGRLFVERGTVELFGGNLEITKGELVFDGQSLTAPRITILASTTADDITAGVSLTGDAAQPRIALFSNPTLPDNEILSRILFGQSASALSPLQAAQLAQAAASLYTGGGPTSILARTRRILGLDQLTLVSGSQGGLPTAVLKAGKEIVKGVTVSVEQGTEAQSGAVSVEVKISPNVTVESRVGQDNKQGVGVNWKWDY